MKYGRRDNNHQRIVKYIRSIPGVYWTDLADVGGGVPDGMITLTKWHYYHQLYLVEIKNPKRPFRSLFTDSQLEYYVSSHAPVNVVFCEDDISRLIGIALSESDSERGLLSLQWNGDKLVLLKGDQVRNVARVAGNGPLIIDDRLVVRPRIGWSVKGVAERLMGIE